MKVRLIDYTSPFLVVLAYKTSRGKVREKGLEHYIARLEKGEYDSGKLCRYLLSSAREWPSALEHVTLTFYIEGCSRVCSHQLVRHRLASYTQESQRYTVMKCRELGRGVGEQFVIPDTVNGELKARMLSLIGEACTLYNQMIEEGVPEEDARFILPQAVKTSLLMTVNLRELLHIAKLRLDEKAQWEIRWIVRGMVREVEQVIPCIWDMVKVYHS